MDDPNYSVPWAKLQVHYGLDDEKRTWMLSDGNANRIFGSRADCHGADRLQVAPTLRTIGRDGPVAHIFWVYWTWQGKLRLEPYCVAAPR
jgi:hypothetical protein